MKNQNYEELIDELRRGIKDVKKLCDDQLLILSERQYSELNVAETTLVSVAKSAFDLQPHLLHIMYIADEVLNQLNYICMYVSITSVCLNIMQLISERDVKNENKETD